MKNILSNKKVVQKLIFALQKKVWKRRYHQISIQLSFLFKQAHSYSIIVSFQVSPFIYFCS